MQTTNKISVIMTLRNTSDLVKRSIKGYLNQSEPPYEIIVVGLPSDLENVKAVTQGSSIPVKFFKFDGRKNDARNLAFKKSSGNYILITDYDMLPSKNLIEDCNKLSKQFEVLIIPEIGANSNNLKARIFKLEKNLVMNDEESLTPRFFRRNLIGKNELPFDTKFGVLDEWGFYAKLKKNISNMGTSNSYFVVNDELTYIKRFIKSFNKGKYFYNLMSYNNNSKKRANLLSRGSKIFASNYRLIYKQPVEYFSLLAIKFTDLLFFTLGYFWSIVSIKLFNKPVN